MAVEFEEQMGEWVAMVNVELRELCGVSDFREDRFGLFPMQGVNFGV